MALASPEPPAYQSLYRRYRPQRFSEILGQEHVTRALRNAVRDGRVGHGYLFSGPRGTGKTSTARILAKALNCEKLDDGEPCGVCDSCVSVQSGTSFAVIELDAASNNGVDAMRDLISRAALGTPGLRKVYIVDEVHMLSTAAANTLLKTLEEPPAHVVFVLATTDPQKVLPTIKSRVQHYEFHLLGAEVLADLVRSVNADAALGLEDTDLDRVVRRGAGSARDALSALDQAAALGGVEDDVPVAPDVVEAMCDRDPGRALEAIAAGVRTGRDPRRMADEILAHLRNAFLAGRAPALVDLPAEEVQAAADQASRLGPAALVRAMETVGEAITAMREALDPRITLEVAIVRVTAPEADTSPAALLERVERIERRLASGGGEGAAGAAPAQSAAVSGIEMVRPASPASVPPRPAPVTAPPPTPARGALGALRGGAKAAAAPAAPAPTAPVVPAADPAPAPAALAGGAELPSRDELTKAWGDSILQSLPARVKARFIAGRFVAVEGGAAVFALPNSAHRDQCMPLRAEVETAIGAHFGRPVPLKLVADVVPAEALGGRADEDEHVAVDELREAPAAAAPASPAERVKSAFPGAEEVDLS